MNVLSISGGMGGIPFNLKYFGVSFCDQEPQVLQLFLLDQGKWNHLSYYGGSWLPCIVIGVKSLVSSSSASY